MELNTKSAIEKIKKGFPGSEEIAYLIKFVDSSKRGIAR